MPDVRIDVYSDQHGAPENLKRTETALSGVERQGGATHSGLEKLWKQFAIGDIASRALSKGFSMITGEVKASIGAAIEAEKVNRGLDAALEITGRGAANLGEHFKDYASELQRVTIYDDEAIKGAQALLVQLSNLDRKGIDVATRGAIGLASVFKMDLAAASGLVAKAMTGNVGALSRYGIKVAENLPLEEKRAALLLQLEKLFGRATAEAGTFGGKLEILKNRWREVQEAAGGFVTSQKGVIELLNKASQTILDYLTMDEMLAKATGRQVENENRLADRLGKAAVAAGWKYGEMAKLIEVYGGVTPALIAAITHEKHGTEIKLAYVEALRAERLEWERNAEARRKAEQGTNRLTTANVKLIETAITAAPWGRHRDMLELVKRQLFENTIVIEGQLPAVNKLSKEYTFLARAAGLITDKENPWDVQLAAILRYTETGGAALSAFDAVVAQGTANRMIAIDNEYSRRLAAINASVTDEDARQQAIAKLDDEFAAKRRAASRVLGLSSKAMAISQAIISTHEAAAKALAQGGFILGIPWATIVAALGYIQVGLIAAQPIPLARGGVFTKRTRLTSDAGTAYEVGEGGEAEILAPGSAISKAVREGGGGRGAVVTIIVQGPLAAFNGATERDLRAAGPILLDILEGEFNKFGMRLLHGRH